MNTGSSSGGPFRSQTGRLTVSRLPPTPIIKSIAGRTTGEVQTREELLRGITEPERLTAPPPSRDSAHRCWGPMYTAVLVASPPPRQSP